MNSAFLGSQESGSHLNRRCSKHKRRSHSSSVCDSSRCNYGNINRINNLRNQCHGGSLTHVASRFTPFRNHCTCSHFLNHSGKGNTCNNADNLYSGSLQLFHILSGITGSGGYNLNMFTANNINSFIYIRTHKHQIYSEDFIRKISCLNYLLAKLLSV